MLEEARRNRETIESAKDSALTSATAGTTGAGQFSTPVPRRELSKEATEAVATAVKEMVQSVLRKEYSADSCMAMLTYIPRDYDTWSVERRANLVQIRKICGDIVLQGVIKQSIESKFQVDDSTARLDAWIKHNRANRERLNAWLRTRKPGLSPTSLLFGEHAALRRLAIVELNVPPVADGSRE